MSIYIGEHTLLTHGKNPNIEHFGLYTNSFVKSLIMFVIHLSPSILPGKKTYWKAIENVKNKLFCLVFLLSTLVSWGVS